MATDDEREPRASSDESLSDRDEAAPRKPAAKKAVKKARPAPVPAVDEDEDDDLDDEDDDLDDEDDDLDDEPPPPRKVSRAPVSKKTVKPAPKKKTVVKVRRVPAKPASSFLPFAFLGMGLVVAHVFQREIFGAIGVHEPGFAPFAVLGISFVIWSFMGIGSANET